MVIALMRSARLQRFQSALMSRIGTASTPLTDTTIVSAISYRIAWYRLLPGVS
jgi:hypothetical protein